MGKDLFEQHVHQVLHDYEAPVPQGAWSNIMAGLDAPAPAWSGSGFAAGIAAGALLLGGLVMYSAQRSNDAPAAAQATLQQADTPEAPVEQVNVSSTQSPLSAGEAPAAPAAMDHKLPQADVAGLPPAKEDPISTAQWPEQELAGPEDAPEYTDTRAEDAARLSVQMPETIAAGPLTVQAEAHQGQLALPPAAPAESAALHVSIQTNSLKGYAPFELEFVAQGSFESLVWDFGPYGKSEQSRTTRTYDKPGTYTAMVTAFDAEGMRYVNDMVTIEVQEGSTLIVPDSFTPNGDGINDSFKAEGVNIASFYMAIVDSRGRVVFETNNIQEAWHYSGPATTVLDAYFAVIRATGADGKEYNLKQRINIIF